MKENNFWQRLCGKPRIDEKSLTHEEREALNAASKKLGGTASVFVHAEMEGLPTASEVRAELLNKPALFAEILALYRDANSGQISIR